MRAYYNGAFTFPQPFIKIVLPMYTICVFCMLKKTVRFVAFICRTLLWVDIYIRKQSASSCCPPSSHRSTANPAQATHLLMPYTIIRNRFIHFIYSIEVCAGINLCWLFLCRHKAYRGLPIRCPRCFIFSLIKELKALIHIFSVLWVVVAVLKA